MDHKIRMGRLLRRVAIFRTQDVPWANERFMIPAAILPVDLG
jgi:hypothetical protein